MATSLPPAARPRTTNLLRLGLLFGIVYFVQGISEPTTGLVSQPDQALLRDWGKTTEQVAAFVAFLTLPWCLKPLFGLLSDFVPVAGYRRKSYLLAASAIAAATFGALVVWPLPMGAERPLLSWLTAAAMAVICGDVVIDALMIESTQPLGMTGRMQSVQWAAIYGGAILTGMLGGVLSSDHRQRLGFAICAIMALGTLLLTAFFIEERSDARPKQPLRKAAPLLWSQLRSRPVLSVAFFLFLWNFNPFSQAVLYLHATRLLNFGEKIFGNMTALAAVGSLLACIAYGFYCSRVTMRWLLHLSNEIGLICNGIIWWLERQTGAYSISFIFGFAYMTGSIIQSDLAARACSLDAAGTVFALFMSICNLASAASMWVGGYVYQHVAASWDHELAFQVLIMVNAAFTACCWFVAPLIPDRLLPLPVEAEPEQHPEPLAKATTVASAAP